MNQEMLSFNLAARRPEYGWLWIAGAVGMILAGFGVQYVPFIEDVAGWRFVLRLLSVLPFLIGSAILTIRQGVRVDKPNGVIETWNGVLPFLRRRTVPLDAVTEVKLARTTVQGRQSTHVFHSVMLMGPDPHVLLWSDEQYPDARAKAEQAAELLNIPLRDEAVEPVFREDGTPIETRSPDTLDASLHQQAAASGNAPPFPIKPDDCRIRVTRESNRYIFEMPPLHRSFALPLCVAVFSLAVAAGLAWTIAQYTEPTDPLISRLFFWSFPATIALIGPPFALGRGINRRTQNETISVTPLALSRVLRQRWTKRTDELPIDIIEEFGYTPMAAAWAWAHALDAGTRRNQPMASAAISLRTDFKRLYIAQGLHRSEQIWLHDALKYLLVQLNNPRQG